MNNFYVYYGGGLELEFIAAGFVKVHHMYLLLVAAFRLSLL